MSSICSCPVALRISIFTTTSRTWAVITARNSRRQFEWDSTITGMTSGQKSFPCVAPMFRFQQHGESGAWVSDLLPNISRIVDDVAFVKSVNTEAINHDPATTFIQTGSQQPGRPSLGDMAQLRSGQRQSEPSRVRRVDLPRLRQQDRSTDLFASLGKRLLADEASRGALPFRG